VASASRATPVRAIIGHPAGSGCALRVDDHAFTGRQGPLGFLEDQRRIRFAAAHRQLAEDRRNGPMSFTSNAEALTRSTG